jgi:alginate O-acetyltransferase complex protein AlgI
MLFNTLQFLLFFILVTTVYYLLPLRGRWIWLLLCSSYFYAVLIPAYFLVLVAVILIDYSTGLGLDYIRKPSSRKGLLVLSLVLNIGLLCFFKYIDFFIENLNGLMLRTGTHQGFSTLDLILPIGLSFHTFQSMSYSIEVYKGRQQAERNLVVFANYVLFYPQLVAGPIERPYHLLHQLREKKALDMEKIKSGLVLICWGLFKKVVISDRVGLLVNDVFPHYSEHSSWMLLIAVVFFAFQIYCDFSGYSDMARGIARVMGYELMVNFNLPYFATSIREFWTRWHISLSSWFRDYVYIPLGGNRVGMHRFIFNILVVFVLSGFWHGANWTFIIWGLLHGLALLTSTYAVKMNYSMNTLLSGILTFSFVCFAWIFFRAESVSDAIGYIQHLFSFTPSTPSDSLWWSRSMIFSFCALFGLLLMERYALHRILSHSHFTLRLLSYITIIYFLGVFNQAQFIYFQF